MTEQFITRPIFRTGDFEVATNITFTIVIPDIPWVYNLIQGILLLPCDPDNWVEEGTATVENATQVFSDIWGSLNGDD